MPNELFDGEHYRLVRCSSYDSLASHIDQLTDEQRANTDIIPFGKNNEKFIAFTRKNKDSLTAEEFKAILNSPRPGRDGPSFTWNRLITADGDDGPVLNK